MSRVIKALAGGLLAVLLSAQTALAEHVDPSWTSVNVGPVQSGPAVSQGGAGFGNSGIAATVSTASELGTPAQALGNGPGFTYVPVPDNTLVTTGGPPQATNGVIAKPGTGFQTACPPGQTGYYVYDSNGMFAGVVCVPNATAPTAPVTPIVLALAQEASARQSWPRLAVGVNPGTGVTGLESWFWLAPANATMPEASATAGPLTVTVKAALIDCLWDFGDGSRIDSGLALGQAYPQQSGIRHIYQTDTYQRPAGYQVLATLRFGVWYSVNAGPWLFLGTKANSYSLSYLVNQVQPEGVPTTP